MKTPRNVVIVEDHRMLREGLKAMLAARDDLKVVGEAGDGLEALRVIKRLKPDFLLLDMSMPRMNGTSVLMEAKAFDPDIKILALTIHQSDSRVREAFDAGADGYCSKNDSRQELMLAIDTVLAGRTYLSSSIANQVLTGYLENRDPETVDPAWESVSAREREILKLLAEGYTNIQIGEMLFISAKTVEKHRSNLMAKLDLHSLAGLTAMAIEKGLIEKNAPSPRKGPGPVRDAE